MLNSMLFLVFVAVAVYAQNLTGFALALVLLGLTGAAGILPLPDVVNAVSIIAVVNAAVFLYRRRALRLDRKLWPLLIASMLGTMLGIAALAWIMGNAYELLRLLLGLSIIYCAWMLGRSNQQRALESSPGAFLAVGFLSGLMNGLFAAGGPPLVFLLYRQPWDLARTRESLMFLNGAAGLIRFAVMMPTIGFTELSFELTIMAVPIVLLVTILTARRPPPFSPVVLRLLVRTLLAATGIIMSVSSMSVLQTT
ncbi:TSUP family transporter [Achromobacter insolitus]|uniref:TSUP family transporter n=1 Tax=Achromobacter insolitus TaxID=217204 RepID=UPI00174DA77C|nr:TSUP family transporter [Achromobacter insolitus]